MAKVTIDQRAFEVTVDGMPVPQLTVIEFRILATLAGQIGRVVSRGSILSDALGVSPGLNTRTVDMHVSRLRAKLGAEVIESKYGKGYRLSA